MGMIPTALNPSAQFPQPRWTSIISPKLRGQSSTRGDCYLHASTNGFPNKRTLSCATRRLNASASSTKKPGGLLRMYARLFVESTGHLAAKILTSPQKGPMLCMPSRHTSLTRVTSSKSHLRSMMEVNCAMLLPTKGIEPQRALLTIGANLISLLDSPATVSGLWERFSKYSSEVSLDVKITFDWFALALSMLFAINAVSWNKSGQLVRCHVSA